MGKYIVYFDSGTSNSRIYLLDKDFQVLYVDKKNVGSRNSSIEGSNRVLIEGLYELYTKLLQEKHLTEEDVTWHERGASPEGAAVCPGVCGQSLLPLRGQLVPQKYLSGSGAEDGK